MTYTRKSIETEYDRGKKKRFLKIKKKLANILSFAHCNGNKILSYYRPLQIRTIQQREN